MMADALEWSFNPWRDRPLAALAGATTALGIGLVVASLAQPLLVRVGLGLAVLGALAPALAPARCRVDEQGVEKRGPFGTVRRPWDALRRASRGATAVLVSPYARPHWLESYRGVVLPLPTRGRDALKAELASRFHDHGL
jgi:hypothetical protein